jgi:FKBP-type peptidyl-prolyl cis-trans isomerase FklB
MKKVVLLALAVMASASFNTVAAKDKKKKADAKTVTADIVTLKSSSDSLSYAAGMSMTNGLLPYLKQQFGVDSTNIADFVEGYKEAQKSKGDPKMKARMAGYQIASQVGERMLPGLVADLKDSPDSISETIFHHGFADGVVKGHALMVDSVAQKFFSARMEADKNIKNEKLYGPNRAAGVAFLAENAKKDSIVTMPDGLQYKVLVKGTGAIPQKTDKVVVKYEGTLIDGTIFDSSYKRKEQTNTFRCDQVIKGWTEALTMMPVGSKWQIFIPQELAYGEREAGKIKPFSALVFTVELVGMDAPKPAVVAKDAKATKSAKLVKVGKTEKGKKK